MTSLAMSAIKNLTKKIEGKESEQFWLSKVECFRLKKNPKKLLNFNDSRKKNIFETFPFFLENLSLISKLYLLAEIDFF